MKGDAHEVHRPAHEIRRSRVWRIGDNEWHGARPGQGAVRAALPDTAPCCPESIAAIATCYAAKDDTGAYLFAAMPKNWNGNLIVFAHGGPSYTPPTATSHEVIEQVYQ